MRNTKCLAMVLAGGQGSRLGALTKHIAKPAIVSLGTCSSVATIPTLESPFFVIPFHNLICQFLSSITVYNSLIVTCFGAPAKPFFLRNPAITELPYKYTCQFRIIYIFHKHTFQNLLRRSGRQCPGHRVQSFKKILRVHGNNHQSIRPFDSCMQLIDDI